MKLAARMSQVRPSATLAVKEAASALAADGVDVVDFGPGEPDFPSPPHAVAAACRALEAGETHYSAGAGLPALRQALAAHLNDAHNIRLTAGQLVVTCGGKSAILYALLALLDLGDEVLLPAPCWVSFPEQVRLAGGVPVIVPGSSSLLPDPVRLAEAITPRTKLLVVNSPCNPSGAVYSNTLWDALEDLVIRRGILLLSDETYAAFNYGGEALSALARPGLADRCLVVSSFSKAYAMTGWRVGWAAGPPALIGAMTALQSQDTTHPATFAQHGALAALTGTQAPLAAMQKEYARRRDLMLGVLDDLPGFQCTPPGGAFYVFPDVGEALAASGCADDVEMSLRLLREAHVAVVAGTAFHGPGHLRLSYAVAPQRIEEGGRRLREWLAGATA